MKTQPKEVVLRVHLAIATSILSAMFLAILLCQNVAIADTACEVYIDRASSAAAKLERLRTCDRVSAVVLSANDQLIEIIANFENVAELRITDLRASSVGIERLKRCPNITSLLLTDKLIATPLLSAIGDVTQLRNLSLEFLNLDDARVARLTKLKQLRTLNLHNSNQITTAGFFAVASLPNIEVIDTPTEKVDPRGFDRLPVTHLSWIRIPKRHTDDWIAHTAKLPLISLNLSGSDLTDAAAKHIARPSLKSLDLSNTSIHDSALRQVGSCPKLEFLSLRRCPISINSLFAIHERFPVLRELEVSTVSIANQNLSDLTKNFPELEEVWLPSLQPEHVRCLIQSKLKRIHVEGPLPESLVREFSEAGKTLTIE